MSYEMILNRINTIPKEYLDEFYKSLDLLIQQILECDRKIVNNSSYMDDVNSIFGMWKDRADTVSVEDTVRNMRRGRQFDY